VRTEFSLGFEPELSQIRIDNTNKINNLYRTDFIDYFITH